MCRAAGAGEIAVWQTNNGTELAALRGHGAFVEQVEFAPDGQHLITAHGDGTIRVSQCHACGPIARVREMANTRATRLLTSDERTAFLDKP
jgi:WD40 repeat protein